MAVLLGVPRVDKIAFLLAHSRYSPVVQISGFVMAWHCSESRPSFPQELETPWNGVSSLPPHQTKFLFPSHLNSELVACLHLLKDVFDVLKGVPSWMSGP